MLISQHLGGTQAERYRFEARGVCIVSSRSGRPTQQDPVSKQTKVKRDGERERGWGKRKVVILLDETSSNLASAYIRSATSKTCFGFTIYQKSDNHCQSTRYLAESKESLSFWKWHWRPVETCPNQVLPRGGVEYQGTCSPGGRTRSPGRHRGGLR